MSRHAMDLGIDLVPQFPQRRKIAPLPALEQAIDDAVPIGRTGETRIGWLVWFVG